MPVLRDLLNAAFGGAMLGISACGGGASGPLQPAPPVVIPPGAQGIGWGADAGKSEPQDHAMAYALFASGAVDDGNMSRAREAASWLISNPTSLGGWGLGWAWDAFSDGSTNPSGATYGIETAMGVRALFDLYEATGESQFANAATRALDGYRTKFTSTTAGGYFWYSSEPADAAQTSNTSAMLAAQYARSWKLLGRVNDRTIALSAISQLMTERHVDAAGAWWSYGSSRPQANDALHAAYVVLGLSEAARYLGTDADFEEEIRHLKGFFANGGVLESHPVANPGALRQSARAGGAAFLALALADTGRVEDADVAALILATYRNSSGVYCYQELTGCGYPRVESQVTSSLSRVTWIAGHPVGRWELEAEQAEFEPRDSARPFVFNGHLWITNGYVTTGVFLLDLWRSTDGSNWIEVLASTPYDEFSSIALHNGWLYAAHWSVWRSQDGIAWQMINPDAPFAVRDNNAESRLLSFKGALWYLTREGIWSSIDGIIWTKAPQAPFIERKSYSAVVWKDRLWVMGGAVLTAETPEPDRGYPDRHDVNDVWSSPDGVNWTLEVEHAQWSPRMWTGAVVHNDDLWILGGYDNTLDANIGDVWKTSDGRNWRRVAVGSTFSPRHFPTVFSRDGEILLLAGNAHPVKNDVWRFRTN